MKPVEYKIFSDEKEASGTCLDCSCQVLDHLLENKKTRTFTTSLKQY